MTAKKDLKMLKFLEMQIGEVESLGEMEDELILPGSKAALHPRNKAVKGRILTRLYKKPN